MTLQRTDFRAYFAEMHDGHLPFAWQERLLDRVLADGWPEAVDAPTGAGKTAAIDVHVFALALAAATGAELPPRRLAMIVGRRVLVDDQYLYAREVERRLADRDGPDVLRRVNDGLRLAHGIPATNGSPLFVARLRGGVPPSRRWADHPTAPAVLCTTPEMWGSRLLFRGYGSSARAWSREAGLLAVDTVALVDEAHLAQQLLCTARRVGQLVPVADREWGGRPPLQVVETTATPTGGAGSRVGVDEADLAGSATLADRLRRPKPIALVPRKDWNSAKPPIAAEMAKQVVALRDRAGAGTVGCFVNTVARAVAVADALRNPAVVGRRLTVVMLCGQVRPIDVELLAQTYPDILTPKGNDEVDVIVATQTLEVGVDIDLVGMVTELASGSALAQRAGRVNRRGLRLDGPIVVMVPDGPIRADARSGPYDAEELNAARAWLDDRVAAPDGLAPWALRSGLIPRSKPRRVLLQRPELGQAWHWARTSDDLAADPELDLWLSDDLEPDTTVGLVVRRDVAADVNDAVELVRMLRPRPHEVFAVPIRVAIGRLSKADEDVRRGSSPFAVLPALRVRGDEVTILEWGRPRDGRRSPRLRPGDIVVVDEGCPLFTAPAGTEDVSTPQVVVPVDDECRVHTAPDVLEAPARLGRDLAPGEVVLRIDLTAERYHELAEALILEEPDPPDEFLERDVVRKALDGSTDRMARAAAELLVDATNRRVDVVVLRDDDDEDRTPLRAIVIDGRRAVADDHARQEWSTSTSPVLLGAHQAAVEERAGDLARMLELPADLTAALGVAARHHDDGKADPRFQIRLGARTYVLAKSGGRAGPETVRRRNDRSGLPPQWRHEQRSVVDAWSSIPPGVDRELVARLIGTTHGHGRSSFPHSAAELLGPDADADVKEIATALFDEGEWDELIERTHLRYGVWICAYLEAVLRAADGQISGEGR
ncbi:MAG: type I-U CRISPR-associated helicase/endonuclease Cas3 [Pseudonocardia sp.]|nr:type I-U CRISPR-associated helicase/endonuclease Cas3 [Pseudonocardia sp.]